MAVTTCGTCSDNCRTCKSNQFDCTTCHKDQDLALYQKEVQVENGVEVLGRCVTNCPTQYFMDTKGKVGDVDQNICKKCQSPCLMCTNTAD